MKVRAFRGAWRAHGQAYFRPRLRIELHQKDLALALAGARAMGIEAHIFVAFLAYCLQVSLKAQLRNLARGITLAEVIAKFKTMQMVDVHVPTSDGRELVLSRYTQPEPDHRMLLEQLQWKLPAQPPPKITAKLIKERLPAMPV